MSQALRLNTTIKKYFRGEGKDMIVRGRRLLAALESKGRITYNHGGDGFVWTPRYKRSQLEAVDPDNIQTTFTQQNKHIQAKQDWRAYEIQDSMSKYNKLVNRGKEAIVNVWESKIKALAEDLRDGFANELYVDGGDINNSKRIHGLESIFGYSGTLYNGRVGNPNDVYAGLGTAPGFYGGSWNGDFPTGEGDAQYDFFTPLILIYNTNNWSSGNSGFDDNITEIIHFAGINMQTRSGKTPDLLLMGGDQYSQFMNKYDDKQRIQVTNRNSLLVKLGFSDVMNVDGIDVTTEYGVPANAGYFLSYDKLELLSMQSDLFHVWTPDEDIETTFTRLKADFFGNMKIESPKFCGKILSHS